MGPVVGICLARVFCDATLVTRSSRDDDTITAGAFTVYHVNLWVVYVAAQDKVAISPQTSFDAIAVKLSQPIEGMVHHSNT